MIPPKLNLLWVINRRQIQDTQNTHTHEKTKRPRLLKKKKMGSICLPYVLRLNKINHFPRILNEVNKIFEDAEPLRSLLFNMFEGQIKPLTYRQSYSCVEGLKTIDFRMQLAYQNALFLINDLQRQRKLSSEEESEVREYEEYLDNCTYLTKVFIREGLDQLSKCGKMLREEKDASNSLNLLKNFDIELQSPQKQEQQCLCIMCISPLDTKCHNSKSKANSKSNYLKCKLKSKSRSKLSKWKWVCPSCGDKKMKSEICFDCMKTIADTTQKCPFCNIHLIHL
jgi:hypothetical protein